LATDIVTPALASAPTIYDELYAIACRVDFPPRREGEHFEQYAVRLLKAVYAATEEDQAWNSLSTPAQVWYNAATHKMNAGMAILQCPGYTEFDEPRLEGNDLMHNVREIVAQHPGWSRKEIAAALKQLGWRDREIKLNTIAVARSHMLDAMAVMRKLGMLKEPEAVKP
jgi:hypothetical protein